VWGARKEEQQQQQEQDRVLFTPAPAPYPVSSRPEPRRSHAPVYPSSLLAPLGVYSTTSAPWGGYAAIYNGPPPPDAYPEEDNSVLWESLLREYDAAERHTPCESSSGSSGSDT
jgi:hypothetical protein